MRNPLQEEGRGVRLGTDRVTECVCACVCVWCVCVQCVCVVCVCGVCTVVEHVYKCAVWKETGVERSTEQKRIKAVKTESDEGTHYTAQHAYM